MTLIATAATALAALQTARQIIEFVAVIRAGDDLTDEERQTIDDEARRSDAEFDARVAAARARLGDGS